jgi:uncharacterized protein YndB with AHSA1/START domain
LLRAPRERVWRAISDSKQFGTWFGAEFYGPFAEHATVAGKLVPTAVDPEVAKLQQPHAGRVLTIRVERVEPMRRFAFRWHPITVEGAVDLSKVATTLVEFALEDAPEGTMLKITESGFDSLPSERRDASFKSHEGGWTHQAGLIEKYLARTA